MVRCGKRRRVPGLLRKDTTDTTTTTLLLTLPAAKGEAPKMSNNATADPIVLVRPAQRLSASGNVVSDDANGGGDDQPILMEARLVEMISSLRQLIHSNRLLEEALAECHDEDLIRALEENDGVILRKRDDARALAARLKRHGVNIDVRDMIPRYDGSAVLGRMMKERRHQDQSSADEDGGMHL
jgi:hypothetical protein